MKRFFCDLCESEMTYSSPAVVNTNDTLRTVLIRGVFEVSLRITIKGVRRKEVPNPEAYRSHNFRDRDPVLIEKKHADLCAPCRWALVEQLRGDHSLLNDTPLPPAGAKELKWDATPAGKSDDGFNPDD